MSFFSFFSFFLFLNVSQWSHETVNDSQQDTSTTNNKQKKTKNETRTSKRCSLELFDLEKKTSPGPRKAAFLKSWIKLTWKLLLVFVFKGMSEYLSSNHVEISFVFFFCFFFCLFSFTNSPIKIVGKKMEVIKDTLKPLKSGNLPFRLSNINNNCFCERPFSWHSFIS